ncbi:MAG: hypothetical protein SVV03_00770 [Candidatus Nanohaloarchaea archaeon]|nr:hypothetical protein [Candidatus Nanohaloarchaea archaeon]
MGSSEGVISWLRELDENLRRQGEECYLEQHCIDPESYISDAEASRIYNAVRRDRNLMVYRKVLQESGVKDRCVKGYQVLSDTDRGGEEPEIVLTFGEEQLPEGFKSHFREFYRSEENVESALGMDMNRVSDFRGGKIERRDEDSLIEIA